MKIGLYVIIIIIIIDIKHSFGWLEFRFRNRGPTISRNDPLQLRVKDMKDKKKIIIMGRFSHSPSAFIIIIYLQRQYSTRLRVIFDVRDPLHVGQQFFRSICSTAATASHQPLYRRGGEIRTRIDVSTHNATEDCRHTQVSTCVCVCMCVWLTDRQWAGNERNRQNTLRERGPRGEEWERRASRSLFRVNEICACTASITRPVHTDRIRIICVRGVDDYGVAVFASMRRAGEGGYRRTRIMRECLLYYIIHGRVLH